jgi:hypothetical protein
MPKVSRNTASHSVELEGLEVRLDHLEGGYSVCFEKHTADAELSALFRGLPGDRCPLPRWGYVVNGKVSFVFPDLKETFEAGDAYYVPPGHTRCITLGPRSWNSARPTSWRRRWRS